MVQDGCLPLPAFGTGGHFGVTVGYSISVQRAFIAAGRGTGMESRVGFPTVLIEQVAPLEDTRSLSERLRPAGVEEPTPEWITVLEQDLPWWTKLFE